MPILWRDLCQHLSGHNYYSEQFSISCLPILFLQYYYNSCCDFSAFIFYQMFQFLCCDMCIYSFFYASIEFSTCFMLCCYLPLYFIYTLDFLYFFILNLLKVYFKFVMSSKVFICMYLHVIINSFM